MSFNANKRKSRWNPSLYVDENIFRPRANDRHRNFSGRCRALLIPLAVLLLFLSASIAHANPDNLNFATFNMGGATDGNSGQDNWLDKVLCFFQNGDGQDVDFLGLQEAGWPSFADNPNHDPATSLMFTTIAEYSYWYRSSGINRQRTAVLRYAEWGDTGLHVYHLSIDQDNRGARNNLAVVSRIRAERVLVGPPLMYGDGSRNSNSRPFFGIEVTPQGSRDTGLVLTQHSASGNFNNDTGTLMQFLFNLFSPNHTGLDTNGFVVEAATRQALGIWDQNGTSFTPLAPPPGYPTPNRYYELAELPCYFAVLMDANNQIQRLDQNGARQELGLQEGQHLFRTARGTRGSSELDVVVTGGAPNTMGKPPLEALKDGEWETGNGTYLSKAGDHRGVVVKHHRHNKKRKRDGGGSASGSGTCPAGSTTAACTNDTKTACASLNWWNVTFAPLTGALQNCQVARSVSRHSGRELLYQSNNDGFLNEGFLNFGGIGSSASWDFDIDVRGPREIRFRYAVGSTTDRRSKIYVNGIEVGTVTFANTGGWSNWSEDGIEVLLDPGQNTVTVEAATTRGGPNLDHVYIISTYPFYEAEEAVMELDTRFADSHSGFTGRGFVDFGGQNSSLSWKNLMAPGCGTYVVNVRYANGSNANRPSRLEVAERHGVTTSYNISFPPFPSSPSWDEWSVRLLEIEITDHTEFDITLTATSTNGGPNIDQLGLIQVEPKECRPVVDGRYENDGIPPSSQNAWHFVTITVEDDGTYLWTNDAGVSWSLTPTADPNVLDVGPECPYYASGYTQATLSRGTLGEVLAIGGPGGESYTRQY